MFRYYAKTALVTGASTGIGAAFARALAARGTALILVARRAGALDALAAELAEQHGIAAHVVPLDLSLPEAAARLSETVAERGWQVDLLINNAGCMTYGPLESTDPRASRPR